MWDEDEILQKNDSDSEHNKRGEAIFPGDDLAAMNTVV